MMKHTNKVFQKKTPRIVCCCLVFLCVLIHMAAAIQAQQVLPDVGKFGPQIGESVPDFLLPDQHGMVRDLNSILGQNGALIVFSRSVRW